MKKKKLTLERDVISILNANEMNQERGGTDYFCGGSGGSCPAMGCGPTQIKDDTCILCTLPPITECCGTGPCTTNPCGNSNAGTPPPDDSGFIFCQTNNGAWTC